MTDLLKPLRSALVDRYEVEREIGHGGMSRVFLARDLKLPRSVAIKVLRPEVAAALGAERFLREIEIAARLNHPHILPLHDSGEARPQGREGPGLLYYVMPYVEGESLRDRLTRERQLSVNEAVRIIRQVASALSYAHSLDVVHRDIKPENILLAGDEVVVADLGIARAITAAGGDQLTSTGIAVGTPAYMSPEQGAGESHVDGRSDVFSLGCVLYEMLAGTPPFVGATAQAIQARRLTDPVPPLRTVRETVPAHVERAIETALAKVPADRFATAGQFMEALGGSIAPRHPTRRLPVRRVAGILGVAVVLALPIAAGVAWYLSARRPVVPAAASVIAVVPFSPTEADSGLARLGRDLASTISASLDAVGEIRTVDRLTVLAQVGAGSRAQSLVEAGTLARQLGAASVVHGTLAREGTRVRLDAGLYSSDSLAPLARIELRAPPESLSAITDSVTRGLLQDIWRRGRPPTPTLEAALATHSVQALRNYLDGERHLVAGQWSLARAAYGRAIAADSSFWFAYYRYGNANGWAEVEVDSAIELAYRSHRQSLPERERLMIEASRADSGMRRQRAQLQEIVRRWPDYWPAWWVLGDNLWHAYPPIGTGLADARQALERVVALNPGMVRAWHHLGAVYGEERDSAGLARALDQLERLNARATFIENERSDEVLALRTALALLRKDPAATAMLDTMYQGVVQGRQDLFTPSHYMLFWGRGALQIGMNRRLLAHGLDAEDAQDAVAAIALAWAMRGAWDSALAARDRFTPSLSDSLWILGTYRLAVLGAWAGGLSARVAARYRLAAVRLAAPRSPGYRADLAWLDGILAVVAHDASKLASARRRVTATRARWASNLDRSLAAFQVALSGDWPSAGRAMATLERELADSEPWSIMRRATPHTLLRGIDRMSAAEWLLAAGDSAEAAGLLTWHEAASAPFEEKMPLAPLAYRLLARIAEARGDTIAARRAWEQFLVRFDAPVPALHHLVAEAQDALARLSRTPIPSSDR